MAEAVVATPKLSAWSKLSYGLGDFGFGLTWNMVGAFLLFFYTDVAGLPAAAVGTLFLLSRLVDAGVDPLIGVLVDRTHSRWGKVRPYLLFGALPFGLLGVATFWSPPWGEGARLAWAIGTFGLLGLLFSAVNIPYGALMPMMTTRGQERLQLGSLRAAGTAVSVILVTAATMPLVSALGGGDAARGFLLTAAMVAAASTLVILNLFLSCPEQVDGAPSRDRVAVGPSIAAMLRNRAWRVVFVFTLLNFVRFGAVLSVTPFFAINVLGQPWMISVLLPAVSGTLLIGSVLAPPVLRRLGMKRGNLLALIGAGALYLAVPLFEARPAIFLALYVSGSVLLSITMTAIFAMVAEAIDYHEQLFGTRDEGLLSSGISLATKVGMALGGAAIAYGLAAAGYHAGAVSETARGAMRWLYYAPILATIVLQILVIVRYPRIGAAV